MFQRSFELTLYSLYVLEVSYHLCDPQTSWYFKTIQYQVITTDLEDVGIVTVGVLATKLIDLAPSSHSNGMFRTINGAVSVCLEEWSPVNVVHDFLNGMILTS